MQIGIRGQRFRNGRPVTLAVVYLGYRSSSWLGKKELPSDGDKYLVGYRVGGCEPRSGETILTGLDPDDKRPSKDTLRLYFRLSVSFGRRSIGSKAATGLDPVRMAFE